MHLGSLMGLEKIIALLLTHPRTSHCSVICFPKADIGYTNSDPATSDLNTQIISKSPPRRTNLRVSFIPLRSWDVWDNDSHLDGGKAACSLIEIR